MLIGIDYLESHGTIIDYINKKFTCIDKTRKLTIAIGISREILVTKILAIQVKKCVRKGYTLYAIHVLENKEEDNLS